MKEIKSIITWREINVDAGGSLPDTNTDILIYDGYSGDTYKGYLDVGPDGSTLVWIDYATGDPFEDPQFWAEVPFPDET